MLFEGCFEVVEGCFEVVSSVALRCVEVFECWF